MAIQDDPLLQTWIGEDPRGNVCPCAHDVLYVQTGLNASLSSSLGANHSIHLGPMLETPTIQAHELCQISRVVVLLQELKEKNSWLE